MSLKLLKFAFICLSVLNFLNLIECQENDSPRIQNLKPQRLVNQTNAGGGGAGTRSYHRNSLRQTTSATSDTLNNCDNKELIKNLNDRVSLLVTLDEDQRNSLSEVSKKLSDLDNNNEGRINALSAQQMDFLKRMENLEHLQRLSKHTLDEIKELDIARTTRQINNLQQPGGDNRNGQAQFDINSKLDSLAIYLTSTQVAIKELQMDVGRILQATSNLQKRVTNLSRRRVNGVQHLPAGGANRPPSYYATSGPEQQLITSCSQDSPVNTILRFQLTHQSEPFYVLCETDSLYNGEWAVILKRFNGVVNFRRDWLEYKAGFGNLAGEFFIGLEKLHALTSSALHELLVVLEDFEGTTVYARYSPFAIAGESEGYAMNLLGAYEGTAGDSLVYHAGSKFSTFDHDNDGCLECNCAQSRSGGWWYNWCATSNLMGQYYNTANYSNSDDLQNGIFWDRFHPAGISLKKAKMLIRPIEDYLPNRR